MTTKEYIEEMKLPVGTPIQITLQDGFKVIGYYKGIKSIGLKKGNPVYVLGTTISKDRNDKPNELHRPSESGLILQNITKVSRLEISVQED